MSKRLTIELILLQLKEGRTDEDFLRAADESHLDLREMPGFLFRELLKNDQGQWVDIIHWRSLEDALSAAAISPYTQVLGLL